MMADTRYCKVKRDGRVFIVTLDRPDVMNALHRPASLELEAVFDAFTQDPDLWVAIVTGSGDKAFCAGNDLKYQAAGSDTTLPASGFAGLTARFGLNKPVIAAVNGLALGGGFELALSCDLTIAAEHAEFALPEPRVGVAATAGGLVRLPQQVPLKQAMGMILTGRRVTAQQGQAFGFVNEVVPHGQALAGALRWSAEILEGSPMSIRASKEMAAHAQDAERCATLLRDQASFPAMKALLQSQDFQEGPLAFAEKRRPQWKGH